MTTLNIGVPSPKQALFLRATSKYVGFGGARGGGKSWAVRAKAILLALRYPGIRVMIVRRTYPELTSNHIQIMRADLVGVAKYNDKDKQLRFGNGSMINFQYCSNDADLDRVQGIEIDVLFIDEAEHFTEYQIKAFSACVRGANTYPKRIYCTMNPGGVGHAYLKRVFVDRRFEDGENPDDYTFIQSLVTDNDALMRSNPDYIHQLEALPPKLREAWLHGNWDIYEGQFFETFTDRPEHYIDRQYTHVIEPFEIDDSYVIYRCFDWGYNKPFACEWFAYKDDVLYNILELYGCTKTPNEGVKWTPKQVFEEIHRIECEHRWLRGRKVIGVADPAIWNAESGESIAETAAKNLVYFAPGDNTRLAGWMQMQYRLAFDDNGFPMIYFFKTCKGAIRTLPLLMYDEHRPEDLDTTGEDHIADAIRYLCMERKIKPRVNVPADPYYQSPMAVYLDIPKEDVIARPDRARMEIISNGQDRG